LFGHLGAMGPLDWLFWCSTATNECREDPA